MMGASDGDSRKGELSREVDFGMFEEGLVDRAFFEIFDAP